MPELPDVELYVHALGERIVGRQLQQVRLTSPFLLRSVEPPLASVDGRGVTGVRRLGKRIAIALAGDDAPLWLVIHLMIAGRLRWRDPAAPVPRKLGLAAFDFAHGTLILTEAGKKKRASLHVAADLGEHERGGLEPLEATREQFAERLISENHTLKRALTDPTLFSGIGNAYSDEILHRAKLPPTRWTRRLDDEGVTRLYEATRRVLTEWVERLRAEVGDRFPEKVTAFRPEMAVHGRFGKACPDCGEAVQRIVYSQNESNYCPKCQTGGNLLADRALSRLLRGDWPKSVEELEARKREARR